MWGYVICFLVGAYGGVMLMCIMAMASHEPPMRCTGNCRQGRDCTCWQTRQRFDEESV